MSYRRSIYRADFESRVKELREEAGRAQKLARHLGDQNLSVLHDMVFQCAIFQTSAAQETYLKLVIESWAQAVRREGRGDLLPLDVRAYFARKRLNPIFKRFAYQDEEVALHKSLAAEADLWTFLNGQQVLPNFFDGRALHEACAYPSFKNLKRLFTRIGIENPEHKLNRILKRDVETMVGSFQDIRTALAHSAPPRITIKDVRDRLGEQTKLVASFDRLLFEHIVRHGGTECWSEAA